MGIRKNVNGRLELDLKRFLLLGIAIFAISGAVGPVLSHTIAYAQEPGAAPGGTELEASDADMTLIESLVDAWNSAIAAIEQAIDALQIQINEEASIRSEADTNLQNQIDELSGASSLGASSGVSGSIAQYSVTVSGTIPSNDAGLVTALCNNGDVAVSGTHEIMHQDTTAITIYDSENEDPSAWEVPAFNEHSTDDIQIDVTVNCVEASDGAFSKADNGFS